MTAVPPTWSILVPTLGERVELFDRLMAGLLPQLDAYEGRVQVVAWRNDGSPRLAELRQRMVEMVDTDYLSFIDDDDTVPGYFVAEVMTALESRPDYVGWQTHYFANGKDHGLVDHSLRHGGWFEVKQPYGLYRDISHINPMRSDAAKAADFRVALTGQVEDRPWVDQIRQGGLLQTEVYLPKPMYHYRWNRKVSAWSKPHRIRKSRVAPREMGSAHFTWHPDGRQPIRSWDDERMVEDSGKRVSEPGSGSGVDDRGGVTQLQAGGVPGGRGHRIRPEGDVVDGGRSRRGGSEAGSGVRPEHALAGNPRLAVLIPTRGRPGNLAKVISAWDFTNAWDHADMVVIADADDPQIQGYRTLLEQTRKPSGASLFNIHVMAEWMPMVSKLNQVALDYAELDDYAALGFAGDDHLPQTMNWARRYLSVLDELVTGMVFGDDGYQGANLSTEWAVTSDAVRALGRMVPADVEHLYCDNAMMVLYNNAGALRHLPEVRIEHMHPIANKAENDDQYKKVNSRIQYKRDGLAYAAWLDNPRGMATDVDTIQALRKGLPEVRPTKEVQRKDGTPPAAGPRRGQQRSKPSGRRLPYPRHFRNVRGATPDEIMMTIADFAAMVPADQEIVELGVFQGRSSIMLAWGASQGGHAHVTGIDPWDLEGNVYDPPFTDAGSEAWARYWLQSFAYGDKVTLIKAFSHDIAAGWIGRPVGLLFVDGDHTKAGARRDIEAWAPYLAPGARIAIDDYGHPDWPGVGEAIDELVAEGILEPIEVFHDRLAVTRLVEKGEPSSDDQGAPGAASSDVGKELDDAALPQAITSEGVSPSPEVDLESMNLGQLRALAKKRGLKASTKTRPELLELLA